MQAEPINEASIERALLALLATRSPKSVCPSEIARALASGEAEWRALMPAVRTVAVRLAHAGLVSITRAGQTLAPNAIEGGPIRIIARDPTTSNSP